MEASSQQEIEVTSISTAAGKLAWVSIRKYGLWLFAASIAWDFFVFFMQLGPESERILLYLTPWFLALAGVYGHAYSEARHLFWKQFAARNGFMYPVGKDFSREKALLFQEGHSGDVSNCIRGSYGNLPLDILEYNYTIGHGKHKSIHYWTIFEFKVQGTFPHLYLNYTKDNRHIGFEKRVFLPELRLPAALEDKFKLYVPKEYEIEALDIFSPDTLQFLLDNNWRHDLELVESELLIFRPNHFSNTNDLETEFSDIKKFVDHLAPKLNRTRFAKIGDLSPML